VNLVLIASAALVGLATAPASRAIIIRYTTRPSAPRPPLPGSNAQSPASIEAKCAIDAVHGIPPLLAVGVVAAVALGVLAARVHPGLVLAADCWFAVCAVPLVFIDVAVQRLPDPLTGTAFAGSATLLAAAAFTAGHPGHLTGAAIGAAALPAFYLLLFLIRPSGMGLGDIKLAASTGALLGWLGWPQEVAATFLTFTAAALYAIALLATRRATRTTQFPLGPFIIAGALLTLLT
jgi:leader peptidase (prepilin peptidase)/N-methyltransferase